MSKPFVIEKSPKTTDRAASVNNPNGRKRFKMVIMKKKPTENEISFTLSSRRDQNLNYDLQPASKLTISWRFSTNLDR